MRTTKTLLIGCTAAFALAACNASETSEQTSALTGETQANLAAAVVATHCALSPSISLDGKLTLSGLGVRLTFRNNEKGTHENVQDLTSDVVLVPVTNAITIPNDGSETARKNPYVWIQILDANGNAVSGEMLLGHCADGLVNVATTAPIVATAHVDVEHCDNSGPTIDLGGSVSLAPLTMRVIFRDALDVATSTVVVTRTDAVVVPLTHVAIPKQPSRGGVGGNPWIYGQLIDGSGNAFGSQVLLGRCVQLEH